MLRRNIRGSRAITGKYRDSLAAGQIVLSIG